MTPIDSPVCPDTLTPEAVAALAERSVARESAAAFQSLLAAAACAVRETHGAVGLARDAALSAGQRDRLAAVATGLDGVVAALGAGVSAQARCLDRRSPADLARAVLRPAPGWLPRLRERAAEAAGRPGPSPTWLAAASAAVEALGQSAEHVATLAAGQPGPSSARALGDRVAAHLRDARDAVLADVARLVD
ncbi:hypothetical protein [Rubrivirga sp. IMCC45206]|uniref:hypothetical protein n=1 Tax=Rubrivirga sp. IMCC45206 TaxID=3391614 RepID=UPI00399014C4